MSMQATVLLFYAMLLMMETECFVRVFNPHSGNPTKYKGNLNQKPLDFRTAPTLSSAVSVYGSCAAIFWCEIHKHQLLFLISQFVVRCLNVLWPINTFLLLKSLLCDIHEVLILQQPLLDFKTDWFVLVCTQIRNDLQIRRLMPLLSIQSKYGTVAKGWLA